MDQKVKASNGASDTPTVTANGAGTMAGQATWPDMFAISAALIERRRRDLSLAVTANRLLVDFVEGCAQSHIDGLLRVARAVSQTADAIVTPGTGLAADEAYRKILSEALDVTGIKLAELSDLALQINWQLAEIVETHVNATMFEVSEAIATGLGAFSRHPGQR